MHRDEHGVWSANVTVFGAWAPGLGYTLDWLMRAPPQFAPRRRMIEHDRPKGPWFSLVDLVLPVAPHRAHPIELHVASVTGTWGSETIEEHLFACADAVVFYAETVHYQLDRAKYAREALARWIDQRGDDAIVVFQLDRPWVGSTVVTDDPTTGDEPIRVLDVETLSRELAIGDRPRVETNARDNELGSLFRVVVGELLAAGDRLPGRPSYVKSTGT